MIDWGVLGGAVAAAFGAVVLVMAVAFAIGRGTGKYSIIDAIWGPGFVVATLTAFLMTIGHGTAGLRFGMLAVVAIWGLRLGGYILLRNHGLPEDPRYADMLKDAGPGRIVAKVQVPQGLTMWVVSLPAQVAMVLTDPVWVLVAVGVAVWLVGFAFEAIGDAQLGTFKKNPANRGQVMQSGLWRYTRHPNYFGESAMWWGIFVMVCWHWLGAVVGLGAAGLITWLLVAKTGKALSEKRMTSSKPGYREYVERTSGFFPLPPKRT